jgi:hypothetical protein
MRILAAEMVRQLQSGSYYLICCSAAPHFEMAGSGAITRSRRVRCAERLCTCATKYMMYISGWVDRVPMRCMGTNMILIVGALVASALKYTRCRFDLSALLRSFADT